MSYFLEMQVMVVLSIPFILQPNYIFPIFGLCSLNLVRLVLTNMWTCEQDEIF